MAVFLRRTYPLLLLAVLECLISRAAGDFAAVTAILDENDERQVEGLRLAPNCPQDAGKLIFPLLQITVMPSLSEGIVVLTTPRDLVVPRFEKGSKLLGFDWDEASVDRWLVGEETGIIVQIPNSQFRKFVGCCKAKVQIFEGFTNLEEISLTGEGSEFQAILDAAALPLRRLDVSTMASATIESPQGFESVVATSEAMLELKGDVFGSIRARSSATVVLEGNIVSGADVSLLGSSSLVGSVTCGIEEEQARDCAVVEDTTVDAFLGASPSQQTQSWSTCSGSSSPLSNHVFSQCGTMLWVLATYLILG